jgi:hypothetical protein
MMSYFEYILCEPSTFVDAAPALTSSTSKGRRHERAQEKKFNYETKKNQRSKREQQTLKVNQFFLFSLHSLTYSLTSRRLTWLAYVSILSFSLFFQLQFSDSSDRVRSRLFIIVHFATDLLLLLLPLIYLRCNCNSEWKVSGVEN